MSSAFLRASRTSSVSSPICLLAFLACLPAFFTCLATPLSPDPVPGIDTPSTFFGFPFSCFPSRMPPTIPAAAVATPVTTAVFEEPFEPLEPAPDEPLRDALLRDAPLREEPLFEEPLRDDALREVPLRDALLRDPPLRDDPLREEPLLDDRFADELLPEDPLREDALPLRLLDALRFFGLDPFELRLLELLDDFLFVPELVLWAIVPPWSLPRSLPSAYPVGNRQNASGTGKKPCNGRSPAHMGRASLEGNSFVGSPRGATAVAAPSR